MWDLQVRCIVCMGEYGSGFLGRHIGYKGLWQALTYRYELKQWSGRKALRNKGKLDVSNIHRVVEERGKKQHEALRKIIRDIGQSKLGSFLEASEGIVQEENDQSDHILLTVFEIYHLVCNEIIYELLSVI